MLSHGVGLAVSVIGAMEAADLAKKETVGNMPAVSPVAMLGTGVFGSIADLISDQNVNKQLTL